MLFRILFWRGEVHTSLKVFAGAKEGSAAHCGDLVMRNGEFEALRQLAKGKGDDLLQFVDMRVRPAEPPPPKKGKR